MKPKNKISGQILRRSVAAILFSGAIVALCSAINLPEQPHKILPPQDNTTFGANRHQDGRLTFADRVAYQRAIEDVYWRHRIWPKERPDSKPSFDAVMSQVQLEKKVEDYLRNSEALKDWQKPITPEQLQAEMDRMAQHTKQPEVLRELFAVLGNDPFVIAECLARPVLAERLQLAAVESRKEPLGSWNAGAQEQMPNVIGAANASYALPVISSPSVGCTNDTWTPTSTTGGPTARVSHTAVWTGSEMIVFGGFDASILNSGGRYDPTTDSWTATSTATGARGLHTAVWTGSEMIVWGGDGNGGVSNTGARYNPSTNSWTATNTTGAPSARRRHTAVWTGSEMIVWGGCNGVAGCHNFFDTGGRYNPSTDSWTATSTTNAPAPRYLHTGVWSGGEMIIWGGYNNSITFNTGGRYNPSTDSWTATSTTGTPTSRSGHTAVWTDSEMIVWGGISGTVFNTGGRYNPSTDSWTATSTTGAPDGREDHVAVWTGSEMVVWCGTNNSVDFNTGGRYNPSTDSWTATSTTNAPRARYVPGSVWTGTEMIAWGGIVVGGLLLDTGGRYCVQSGSPITLDFRLKTQGAKHQVNLQWSPADGGDMNILRNGAVVATVPDNGQAKSSLGTHTGTFTYQVCETDSGDCSNEVTVNVP